MSKDGVLRSFGYADQGSVSLSGLVQGLGRDIKFIKVYLRRVIVYTECRRFDPADYARCWLRAKTPKREWIVLENTNPMPLKTQELRPTHNTTLPSILVLDTASDQTLLRTQRKRWRDRGLERREVVAVDLGRERERRVDDGRVNGKEVLRN